MGHCLNLLERGSESQDLLLRFLDCAVVQAVYEFNREMNHKPYDSVRGVFLKGTNFPPEQASGKRTIFKYVGLIQIALKVTLNQWILWMVIAFRK